MKVIFGKNFLAVFTSLVLFSQARAQEDFPPELLQAMDAPAVTPSQPKTPPASNQQNAPGSPPPAPPTKTSQGNLVDASKDSPDTASPSSFPTSNEPPKEEGQKTELSEKAPKKSPIYANQSIIIAKPKSEKSASVSIEKKAILNVPTELDSAEGSLSLGNTTCNFKHSYSAQKNHLLDQNFNRVQVLLTETPISTKAFRSLGALLDAMPSNSCSLQLEVDEENTLTSFIFTTGSNESLRIENTIPPGLRRKIEFQGSVGAGTILFLDGTVIDTKSVKGGVTFRTHQRVLANEWRSVLREATAMENSKILESINLVKLDLPPVKTLTDREPASSTEEKVRPKIETFVAGFLNEKRGLGAVVYSAEYLETEIHQKNLILTPHPDHFLERIVFRVVELKKENNSWKEIKESFGPLLPEWAEDLKKKSAL